MLFIALASILWLANDAAFSKGLREGIWLAGTGFAYFSFSRLRFSQKQKIQFEKSHTLQGWAFGLLAVITFLFRWFRLSPAGAWPCSDEVISVESAVHLTHNWDGRFFYSLGQSAPSLVWLTSALLKAGMDLHWALWLPPAILSATVPGLAYGAARYFMPPIVSFFLACFLAIGYWPALTGTFSLQECLLVPWACLLLASLGFYLKSRGTNRSGLRALFFGFTAGSGYWTYPSWIAVTLGIGIWFLGEGGGGPRRRLRSDRGLALLAFLAALTPFLWACWKEGSGFQFLDFSTFTNAWISPKDRSLAGLDYLNLPFWGSWSPPQSPWDTQNRGLLNPLTGALAILGGFEIWALLPGRLRWRGTLTLFLFLAPGIFSSNLQPFRIGQILLLVCGAAAWGLTLLAYSGGDKKNGWATAFALLGLCGVWDGARILQTMALKSSQSLPYRQVFSSLEALWRQRGGGLLFTEFPPSPTLAMNGLGPMLFSLKSAPGGHPGAGEAWGAVLVNEYYRPFLEKELPGSQWVSLAPDPTAGTGRLLLGLFPLLEKERRRMEDWGQAQDWLEQRDFEILNISTAPQVQDTLGQFLQPPAPFRQDRFLVSVYNEWLSEFYYRFGFRRHYGDVESSLQEAVTKGFPAAHLYYKLGSLYLRGGQREKARLAFQAALKQDRGNVEFQSAFVLAGKTGDQ